MAAYADPTNPNLTQFSLHCHTEGIESEITVFTPSGILLYRGHDKEIPVRNDGVYIVRSGQQVWKVLVM